MEKQVPYCSSNWETEQQMKKQFLPVKDKISPFTICSFLFLIKKAHPFTYPLTNLPYFVLEVAKLYWYQVMNEPGQRKISIDQHDEKELTYISCRAISKNIIFFFLLSSLHRNLFFVCNKFRSHMYMTATGSRNLNGLQRKPT